MATITSLGIGSGLDLNSIVTQLVALERRPLSVMQTQASRLQTQVSSFGRVSSLFGGLQTAANRLSDPGLWSQSKLVSSDSAVVSATASANGGSTASGNYAVTVQALARNQNAVSNATVANGSELVGAGTLTIDIGTWDVAGTTLTPTTGSSAVQIDVLPGDTLQSLRDKINISGAPVTASLVTDTNGTRLALRSNASGLANAFRVGVTDSDGNGSDAAGLSRFAYDPGAGSNQMAVTQAAGNAQATVNGIAVQSASNQLEGVVDGMTLNLNRTSSVEVTVNATADRDAVNTAVKSFADAYNALVGFIKDQTKFDASTKVAGTLQGDSAVNGIQTSLRNLLGATSGASGAFARLSDIGLRANRDGALEINQATLDKALTDLPELKKAFGNNDALNPANNGFARRYAMLATQVLGTDGTLTTRTDGLRKLIAKNSDDQGRLNDRVDQFQSRLVSQYTAMDANLSRLNSISSLVTQQLAALNRNSGR